MNGFYSTLTGALRLSTASRSGWRSEQTGTGNREPGRQPATQQPGTEPATGNQDGNQDSNQDGNPAPRPEPAIRTATGTDERQPEQNPAIRPTIGNRNRTRQSDRQSATGTEPTTRSRLQTFVPAVDVIAGDKSRRRRTCQRSTDSSRSNRRSFSSGVKLSIRDRINSILSQSGDNSGDSPSAEPRSTLENTGFSAF